MSRLLVNERRQNHMAMHDSHQCNALRISQVQKGTDALLLPPSSVLLPYGAKLMTPPKDTYIDALLTRISELEAQNEMLRNLIMVKQTNQLAAVSHLVNAIRLVSEQ